MAKLNLSIISGLSPKNISLATLQLWGFVLIFIILGIYVLHNGFASSTPPFSVATAANYHLFTANSPWYTRIDTPATQLDPTSAQRIGYMQTVINDNLKVGGAGMYLSSWSTVFVVDSRVTPLVPVYLNNPTWGNHTILNSLWLKGVPIPSSVQGATGIENHATIYDSYTDTLYDFYMLCPPNPGSKSIVNGKQLCPRASSPALPTGTWQAVYGGIIYNASKSQGYYQNRCAVKGIPILNLTTFPGGCDPKSPSEAWYWGSTGTSLPIGAGIITANELANGQINHALAMQLPFVPAAGHDEVCNAQVGSGSTPYAFPAQRGDGTSTAPDCIPEGAKIRLDPSFNLSSLHLSRVAMMIAVALQKYGAIVNDRDATAPEFYIEDRYAYQLLGLPDPYTTGPMQTYAVPYNIEFAGGNYNGVHYSTFPWAQLQLVKMQVCKSSPCAPTLPTVSITSPTSGSTVSGGNVTVQATAASSVSGIAGVQYKLDGINLGSAVTTAPYSYTWDTSNVSPGVHILTAVATDGAGASQTSASVSVSVSNAIVSDDFSGTGSPNSSIWSSVSSDVVLDGQGHAVLPTTVVAPSTTSGSHQMTLKANNPLKGLTARVAWQQIANPSNGGRQDTLIIASANNPRNQWVSVTEAGGSLLMHDYQYGDNITTVPFNAVSMRFWEIKESGGNLYYETSPDGTNWTIQRTDASKGWMASATHYQISSTVYLSGGNSTTPSLVDSFWLG